MGWTIKNVLQITGKEEWCRTHVWFSFCESCTCMAKKWVSGQTIVPGSSDTSTYWAMSPLAKSFVDHGKIQWLKWYGGWSMICSSHTFSWKFARHRNSRQERVGGTRLWMAWSCERLVNYSCFGTNQPVGSRATLIVYIRIPLLNGRNGSTTPRRRSTRVSLMFVSGDA